MANEVSRGVTSPEIDSDRSVRATLLLFAAVTIGLTMRESGPIFSSRSAAALIVALMLSGIATLRRSLPRVSARVIGVLPILLIAAIGVQTMSLLRSPASLHVDNPTTRLLSVHWFVVPYSQWLFVPAACALVGMAARSVVLRRVAIVVLLMSITAIGTWLLEAPGVTDVMVFEHRSADVIARHHNPYDPAVVRFRDIYRGVFYDPSITDGTTLKFGYPYPVASLAATTSARALFGDVRWAMVISLMGCVVLLSLLGSQRCARSWSAIAVAVLTTSPWLWFVLKLGWIEPLVALALVGAITCAALRPRWLPIALGVLITTKQYVPLLLPLTLLVVPWRAMLRKAFAIPVLVGAAITIIPSLLVTGYWYSVFVIQFLQPFRRDSLSLAAWWANSGHAVPGSVFSFAPPLAALLLCLWRAPRNAAGYASACGFVLLTFFAFAKQSFANYYLLVIITLTAAAVVVSRSDCGEFAGVVDTGS